MKIDIYGRPNCTHCDRAKLFLDRKGWDYNYYDLFQLQPIEAQIIKTASGMSSVPIVFINDECIGGADALEGYIRGVEERKV